MIQLGISAFYHDAAACIVKDGKVIAAVEEERFTEIKHDDRFPTNAINWCMNEAGIDDFSIDIFELNDSCVIGDLNAVFCWVRNNTKLCIV